MLIVQGNIIKLFLKFFPVLYLNQKNVFLNQINNVKKIITFIFIFNFIINKKTKKMNTKFLKNLFVDKIARFFIR